MTVTTGNSLSFKDRVVEKQVGPCRLFVLPTPVDGVVSWRGSFEMRPDLAAGDALLQEMTVQLLDKGTAAHDRFALARILEDRGAQLNVYSDGLRVDLSGRALRADVPAVMALLAEVLFEPAFPPAEFEKARAQVAAGLQRELEDTGSQADGELARHLYPPAHPNYEALPEARLEQLTRLERADVKRYHADHFGADGFILAVVGDVDPASIADVVGEQFGSWVAQDRSPVHTTEALAPDTGESALSMPDKNNVDVRLGHALRVRRQDDDYLPLYLANYILGGNFSARLMAKIRDEQGLTYGIGSGLTGISTEYDGHWEVDVTLSRDRLEEGVAATRAEVERFVAEGATETELADKKTTVAGGFKVGLATTGRQARTLLMNAERGFDVAYLDRFPDEVEAVTLEATNQALREHFHPEHFHLALAGTLPEAAELLS